MRLISKIVVAAVMAGVLAGCGQSGNQGDYVQTHVDDTPVPGEPGPSTTSATPSPSSSSKDAVAPASSQGLM